MAGAAGISNSGQLKNNGRRQRFSARCCAAWADINAPSSAAPLYQAWTYMDIISGAA